MSKIRNGLKIKSSKQINLANCNLALKLPRAIASSGGLTPREVHPSMEVVLQNC